MEREQGTEISSFVIVWISDLAVGGPNKMIFSIDQSKPFKDFSSTLDIQPQPDPLLTLGSSQAQETSIPRQNPIDEHERMPVVPVSLAWVLCFFVCVVGFYSIWQIGNPANTWVASTMYGVITMATLMVAGRVLTPVVLRLDRLLHVFRDKS
ncbi:hypothetical protein [uncultured Tateyamaria sp.]|uniref:hypothetical protein n=1 Tax=uncultured Tateyamaria sp. TaxID=455651 RepID=UPI00263257CE|nr:hypothetical protein [uncultured Tateyamaria sp.]